ncbi:hypothetical protein ZWY2020_046495 [Hordeum vulgare]|nr:hypothetical protein ZWY2020_046495 [Hordeum vulgare]
MVKGRMGKRVRLYVWGTILGFKRTPPPPPFPFPPPACKFFKPFQIPTLQRPSPSAGAARSPYLSRVCTSLPTADGDDALLAPACCRSQNPLAIGVDSAAGMFVLIHD